MNFLNKLKNNVGVFGVQLALFLVTAITLIFLWQTKGFIGKILCVCSLAVELSMLGYFLLCALKENFGRYTAIAVSLGTAAAVFIIWLFSVYLVGKTIGGDTQKGYGFMALIFSVTVIFANAVLFLRLKIRFSPKLTKIFAAVMLAVMVGFIATPTLIALKAADGKRDLSYLRSEYETAKSNNAYRVYPDVTAQITADFSRDAGNIKPVNGVNNGPQSYGSFDNAEDYKAADFPFVRLADSLNYTYSGWNGYNHEIDVNAIFPDFSADENDPSSYTFVATDAYMKKLSASDYKVIYRLGCDCELGLKKVDSVPPSDSLKWAKICERIIAHYNEKWAEGFEYGIEYLEIWSGADQIENEEKAYWQGTDEEFFNFFTTAFGYLKTRFPTLKIGGSSLSDLSDGGFADKLLTAMDEKNYKLDFFTYRCFTSDLNDIQNTVNAAAELTANHGLNDAELILSEWNYQEGLAGEDYIRTVQAIKSVYGASFAAATLAELNGLDVDAALYYDARRGALNGLFDSNTLAPIKTYYVFKAFSELYNAGTSVHSEATDGVYALAAKGNGKYYLAFTYFGNRLTARAQTAVKFSGLEDGAYSVKVFLLDETHDLEEINSLAVTSEKSLELTVNPYDFYLIELERA